LPPQEVVGHVSSRAPPNPDNFAGIGLERTPDGGAGEERSCVIAAEPRARVETHQMAELDVKSSLLAHFAGRSLGQRLARVDRAAGKTPDLEILATSQQDSIPVDHGHVHRERERRG
jgi:hypothetical protein